MLSKSDNELITSTGPGTPMGEVFRRFWIPALMSYEIAEPDCAPVELTLLSERLVAFRLTSGKTVLMDTRCPHRHANLYFGRNEEEGIRCAYHGWKFNSEGQCIDMPAEPSDSRFKEHVRLSSYETHESCGIVWTYMGPQDNVPPFPEFEFSILPESHSFSGKRRVPCNYLQNLEGEMDTAHTNFLHRSFSDGEVMAPEYQARTPFLVADTDFGIIALARRNYPDDTYYWRMTPFMLPSSTVIPSGPDFKNLTIAIPLDDENMWGFSLSWRPDRPMDEEDRERFYSGTNQQVDIDPETFLSKYNRSNHYGIDRQAQKTSSFTGIPGVRLQDLAVQEDQDGANCHRWEEHLGTTDRGIVGTRRRLIELAKNLQQGIEPKEPWNPGAFRLRSVAVEAPRSVEWRELWDSAQPQGAVFDHLGAAH
jgi:nitrite reductase/ring-hydroxylating ferredoxin subunit